MNEQFPIDIYIHIYTRIDALASKFLNQAQNMQFLEPSRTFSQSPTFRGGRTIMRHISLFVAFKDIFSIETTSPSPIA